MCARRNKRGKGTESRKTVSPSLVMFFTCHGDVWLFTISRNEGCLSTCYVQNRILDVQRGIQCRGIFFFIGERKSIGRGGTATSVQTANGYKDRENRKSRATHGSSRRWPVVHSISTLLDHRRLFVPRIILVKYRDTALIIECVPP